ncbi:Cytoskeletal Sojo [Gossypium arboreum]|uniref:Cytoskeletal Sojo n=1 Tax=Gossypium arboreum TaxID=29729 RepID=A0A0B0N4I6_GOSAR|nr:Cytoskeletal Sojo [Gossypium arboreum]
MLWLLDSLCEQHRVATSRLTACCRQASLDWGSSEIHLTLSKLSFWVLMKFSILSTWHV